MKHRVRTHNWKDGRLEVLDYWFEQIEEALGFADNQTDAYHIKVFNDQGSAIKTIKPTPIIDSYA
jgi:hypothetical protein